MTDAAPRVPAASMLRPSTPADAMRTASLLQLAPRRVEFPAFAFHHEYVALLSVRNGSDRALRFRVVPPAPASPFKVLYQSQDLATTANPTMMLPPGLNVKFEVVFVPPTPQSERDAHSVENAMIHDMVQLQVDDGSRVDVPLVATKAFPDFELDSSLCDVGLVVLAHRAASVLRVRNVGARPGRFHIDVLDGSQAVATSPPRRASASKATNTVTEEAPISVSPLTGVLLPGESITLKVQVVGKVLGDLRGVLRMRVREHTGAMAPEEAEEEGQEEEREEDTTTLGLSPSTYVVDKIVDVRASVVEHSVELVQRHGGDKVANLFFGSLFAGETRVIETVLRNNGPLPLLFHTTLQFGGGRGGGGGGGDVSGGGGDEDREAYERRKELQVSPAEGRVEPFGEIPLTFTYQPRKLDLYGIMALERRLQRDKNGGSSTPTTGGEDAGSDGAGVAIPLSAFASIQCPAEMQAHNLTLEVAAKLYLPKLELSPASLDFGDIKSHDRADMLVSLKNVSGLPVFFRIPKLAQFSTKPSTGRLDVLQSQTIVVSFVPTQLGGFKGKLEVLINQNVAAYPLLVEGRAAALGDVSKHELVGGPSALPRDFEPKYKFILPADAAKTKGSLASTFHRVAPYELAALNGTAAVDEFEFQGTNNTHLTYCVKELARRDDHRQQYNAFVAELRGKRAEKQRSKAAALKQTVSSLRTTPSNNNSSPEETVEMIEDVAVDLGMDRQGGVEPRPLRLPRTTAVDPLWLENSQCLPGGTKKAMLFDDAKFVKKKFKPAPATQAELADCALSLSFDQLELVACGPKTIHFGKLSVNGLGRKSLSVHNGLAQNILVALQLADMDELGARTLLKAQVIPPQSLAGFDLVFCSGKEQFFQKTLTLTINGVHTRQVTVVAEVAPIVVALSASELPFVFSSTDTNATLAMDVGVTNTSDSTAPFAWKLLPPPAAKRPESSKSTTTTAGTASDKAVFEIVPASGTLGPGETVKCQVIYTPPSTNILVQPGTSLITGEFQLDVVGGKRSTLTCRAQYTEAKYQLKDKKTIDFGTIAVGMEREKKLVLANTASEDSQRLVFYASVEPASVATALGLSISPTIGSILPQDACDISVKISPHKPLTLEGSSSSSSSSSSAWLNLQLRGGKCVKVPLLASVVVPEVVLSQATAFDFGDVVVGVSVPRVVALENRASIPASLQMDLSASLSSEFSIVLPPSLTKHLEDVSSVFIPVLPAVNNASLSVNNGDEDTACAKWQLCIPPSTTVSFHLVFTPQRPGTHDAVLPLQFSGLPLVPSSSSSSPSIARPEAITRRVTARAVPPRVLFSPSADLHFHRCVITREGIRKVPYTKTLVLTNQDPSGATVKWQIDTSRLKAAVAAVTQASSSKRSNAPAPSPVFHLAPDKGELAPGEDVSIRVSFLPLEAAEYSEDELPLLLDGQFYLNLRVSGVGIHPHLSFSHNKLVLPTVPLGLPSSATFLLHSTGYDHLELTYRLPLDVAKAPIALHFPKGKILSMACPTLPCEVRFVSKRSVAFNARIEFFDADGNVFGLPIAGCTENCLLTNHEAVARGGGGGGGGEAAPLVYYTHPSHAFPVYLLGKKQAESEAAKYKTQLVKDKNAAATTASSAPPPPAPQQGFVDVDATAFTFTDASPPLRSPAFSDGETQFLLQYLNANFFKSPVVKFPEDIADPLGKPLYELLEMVCTKRPPPNAVVGSSSSTDKPKVNAKLTNSSSSSSAPPSKKELLAQYTSQYTELLKFLKSYGAMLHDVVAEQLLPQELYVRACEDPRADPAILSSSALLQMKFLQRRHALQREWPAVSARAWTTVLYQVIKCFLLYRVTQKSYSPPPPLAPPAKEPRACQGSNVYSEAEMVLLQWICDHTSAKLPSSAGVVPEGRLLDLRTDLADGRLLFHLLASHIPTLSLDNSDYRGFRLTGGAGGAGGGAGGGATPHQNAPVLLHALRCFGVDFGMDEKRFLTGMTAREMVLLLLHLYQLLPQFIPKATIEFKGVLGQDMEKTIELKNPSTRAIQYHVFLDSGSSGGGEGESGCSDFRIEASHVTLEPGRTLGFVVGCKPKFSKKVTARLVFQAVRDPVGSSSSSSSSGATMVFLLASHITARKPVRVITIEAHAYEKKVEEIVVENQFFANANYKLTMTQTSGGAATTLTSSPSPATSTTTTTMGAKTKGKAGGPQAAPPSSSDKDKEGSHGFVRRHSNNAGGGLSAEHTWCIAAQQPFYLPEYGAAASGSGGDGGGGGGVVVAIRSQASATLKLEFLPLVPGNFKCQLLFLDEKVGEFVYEIQGTAHLPVPTETLEFQCELTSPGGAGGGGGGGRGGGAQFIRELTLPPKNLQLNKALAVFVERASGLLKTKLKEGLKKCEESHHAAFAIEFNSPYFSPVFPEMTMSHTLGGGGGGAKAPKQSVLLGGGGGELSLTARTEISGGGGGGGAESAKPSDKKHLARLTTPRGGGGMPIASPNAVLLAFQPRAAGLYTCKLLLRSHNTVCGSSDWRVYELVAKVKEPNVKTLLEFVSPARHSIVQDIPLTNPSETAWTLKAVFGSSSSSSSPSSFTGPSSLHVPAKKTVNYPLTFSPKWIAHDKTSLVLLNPLTQQQFEFELSGVGEEPLAQDHVVLRCQARTSLRHEFAVASLKTDPPGPQLFKVESDLRDVVGASTVTVPRPGDTAAYPLTFTPLVSGTYFGSITFTNTVTSEYLWYTIEATVAPPAPEATLEMKTLVRSAMGVEISLANPLDHAVTFAIELQGRGLMGPPVFTLEGRASGVYELVYSPLAVTIEDGAVLFANDEIGQFWYALQLTAEPAPPSTLEDMSCAVGDVCTQPIWLSNPSESELLLQATVSNARNYSLKTKDIRLPPFGQASVLLEYTPSSLSEFEAASVVFSMPEVVSEWAFSVKGKGTPPSVMKPLTVTAKVNEAASTLFTFKNPFVGVLTVDVKLTVTLSVPSSSRGTPVFDILLKKPRVTLDGFGQLQVPISFLPHCVCEAQAEIVIHGQDEYAELEWRYPIHGVAEAPLHPKTIVLACAAREPLEKTVYCELLAAPPGFSVENETLTVEWEVDGERFGALASAAAIQRCLHATPLPLDPSQPWVVPYAITFEPLRPYRGSVYLVIHKRSGGKWRFDVALDVSDPPVDDVITIESSLNQTASVSFQLRNQFRVPAPCHAEFSAGSSSAFTVYPSTGTLPPFGSDYGLNFTVSFTPTGYGKMQSGQLLIVTEEMQWTFHFKGAYPDASVSSKNSASLSSSASRSRLGIDSASPATSSKPSSKGSRGSRS